MEKKQLRIVNKGLAGEPQYFVIQEITTNKIFEFSQIKNVVEANSEINSISLVDNELQQPLIQRILSHGHIVNATWDENDNVTCHFNI